MNSTNGSSGETSGGTGGTFAQSGANQGGAGGEAGGDPAIGDTPPTVIATSPTNYARGVPEDATITFTFSEPMNTDTVTQAYVSDNLPIDSVDLSWDDSKSVLSIHPKVPLAYAQLDDKSGSALKYSITIGSTASDPAGNPLAEDFEYSFRTLRDITQELTHIGAYELTHPNDQKADTSVQKCAAGGSLGPMWAGDNDKDIALGFAITYNNSELPDGIVEWKSATVEGSFTTSAQDPFGETQLGELWGYAPSVAISTLTWSTAATLIGSAAQSAAQQRFQLDVRNYLADFYENRPDHAFNVLFKFQRDTNVDGIEQSVATDCDEMSMQVEYLVP